MDTITDKNLIKALSNAEALDRDGRFNIKKGAAVFDGQRYTYKNFVYVMLDLFCKNNCKFCFNKGLHFSEEKENKGLAKKNFDRAKASVTAISEYSDVVVFGGGEPLFMIDDIFEIFNSDKFNPKRNTIITSAPRKEFLDFINNKYRTYNSDKFGVLLIYLSRHGITDAENQKLFNTCEELLKLDDIKRLDKDIKNAITMFVVCSNEGVTNVGDMVKYIKKMNKIGIKNIQFSTLETPQTELEKNVVTQFELLKQKLLKMKYLPAIKIAAYGGTGYTLDLYSCKKKKTVCFKHYIRNKDKALTKWRNTSKRMFDFYIWPNGEIHTGFHPDIINIEEIVKNFIC